jgi:hypothetical protein
LLLREFLVLDVEWEGVMLFLRELRRGVDFTGVSLLVLLTFLAAEDWVGANKVELLCDKGGLLLLLLTLVVGGAFKAVWTSAAFSVGGLGT